MGVIGEMYEKKINLYIDCLQLFHKLVYEEKSVNLSHIEKSLFERVYNWVINGEKCSVSFRDIYECRRLMVYEGFLDCDKFDSRREIFGKLI